MVKVEIFGEINKEKCHIITSMISDLQLQKNREDIIVLIDSCGGIVDCGFEIFKTLKALKNNVITVISGECRSIASIIFLAGKERYVLPQSILMMHQSAVQMRKDTTMHIPEFMRMLNDTKEINNKLFKTVQRETEIPDELLKKIFINEKKAINYVFSRKEIKKYKIANYVSNYEEIPYNSEAYKKKSR